MVNFVTLKMPRKFLCSALATKRWHKCMYGCLPPGWRYGHSVTVHIAIAERMLNKFHDRVRIYHG